MTEITRNYSLPNDSFFLFGPRGSGKSTWLRSVLEPKLSLNLLKNDVYLKYISSPHLLRDETSSLKKNDWVWIDEVQKVPALLDEVHYLIEEKKIKFALSGSSTRKLKRYGANLLAGRAVNRFLPPFSFSELDKYDVDFHLEYGNLPLVFSKPHLKKDILRTYVATYLREEIQEEGHVRKVEPFVRFLEVAAEFNGFQINKSNIAREAQISRPSIESYFSILVDTLVGHWLPAYQPKIKVKEQNHPKFYWFDCGVARAASGRLDQDSDKEWLGRSFETLFYHELRARNYASNQDRKIYHYRTQSGFEIDFLIELRKATLSKPSEVLLFELKNSKRWDSRWEKNMRSLQEHKKINVKKAYGIYRGDTTIERDDMSILPIDVFLRKLHDGEVF